VALVYRYHRGGDGDAVASALPAGPPSVNGPPAASANTTPSEAQRRRLTGRWQRTDANYVLEIRAVADDGHIDAAYLNPRPIHVAQARATVTDGMTLVLVELRDRLYPGSYYALGYEPRHDRLVGVFNHLGLHQQFDVIFTRIGSQP
jgi:hypothetical protein